MILPPDTGWDVFTALLAVSFATSFTTAAFGIGGGVALLAVLASLLPPAALIPVHGVVQFGSNLGRMGLLIRHVDWPLVTAFALGSVIGAGLGGAFAVQLPPGGVQIGVGLFILWSVAFRPPAFLRRQGAVTGAVSTFLTMFFGATGPFVAAYLKSRDLGRYAFVATHATMMTLQHVFKTLAFGLLGFAFAPWLPLIAGMIATGFLGTLAGKRVLGVTTDARFHVALNFILTLLALRLVWAGLADLRG